METWTLDAAFSMLISREVAINRGHEQVDEDTARLHELRRQCKTADLNEIESAFARAKDLLAVACELADESRGPANDGKGPQLDWDGLARRCPGFSRATYAAAINEGFLLTR